MARLCHCDRKEDPALNCLPHFTEGTHGTNYDEREGGKIWLQVAIQKLVQQVVLIFCASNAYFQPPLSKLAFIKEGVHFPHVPYRLQSLWNLWPQHPFRRHNGAQIGFVTTHTSARSGGCTVQHWTSWFTQHRLMQRANSLILDSKLWAAKHFYVQACTDMHDQMPG